MTLRGLMGISMLAIAATAVGEAPPAAQAGATPHSREFWKAVAASDYAVPKGETAIALLPEAEAMLGSTDSEVREELGYGPISVWVYRDGRFSAQELEGLTSRLRDNLKVGAGERDTDTVFLRSFSALALVVLVAQDARTAFLTQDELGAVLDAAVALAAAERDLRGYVPGRGWAHAGAHTADLLKLLARHPRVDAHGLERILAAIAALTQNGAGVKFAFGEDERLARAAVAVLRRDLLPAEAVKIWSDSLVAIEPRCWERYRATGTLDTSLFAAASNARGLLLNLLFFQELEEKPSPAFAAARAVVRAALASGEPH